MNTTMVRCLHVFLLVMLITITDLTFWYSNGPGNPTSAAMGKGWVQELLSRLTQTPISETGITTNNYTLVNNSITFPLNQPIYVDATHDTVSRLIPTTTVICTEIHLLDHFGDCHYDELH